MKKFWLAWGLSIMELAALVYIVLSATKYPGIAIWASLPDTLLHGGFYVLLVAVVLVECLAYWVACTDRGRAGSCAASLLMVYNFFVLHCKPDCAVVTWVVYGLCAAVWLAKGLSVYLREREWDFLLTCLRTFLIDTMLIFSMYHIYLAQSF